MMPLAFLTSFFYFVISNIYLPPFSQFMVVFKCFPLLTPEAREHYSKLLPSVVVDWLSFDCPIHYFKSYNSVHA